MGIVADMTKFVTDAGGNVGDSQAAKLGSYFSLMMMVEVPEPKVDDLIEKLSSMTDMNASVYHASDDDTKPTPKIGCTFGVDLIVDFSPFDVVFYFIFSPFFLIP